MTVMILLRVFADLGFYYAFAATVSSSLGGRFHFPALLLLGACYAACCRFREQKRRQRLVLAAAALAVLLPVPWGDRLAYIPALGYVVYLVRRGDRDLSRARQAELFEIFIRAFALFAFFWCAVRFISTPLSGISPGEMVYESTHDFLSAGVPMAIFAGVSTMLLLRSARHEPPVYLQPKFQAVNVGIVAAVLAVCALLASPLAVRLIVWLYKDILIPMLLMLSMAIGLILSLLLPLLKLLVALAQRSGITDAIEELLDIFASFFDTFEEASGLPAPEVILRTAAAVIAVWAIAIAIFLLRFFLYWLAQRWRERTGAAGYLASRILPAARPMAVSREEKRARNDVERVRQQYRAFLRFCRRRGMALTPSSTSADISRSAGRVLGRDLPLEEIQALYCRARYQGRASRADAARMKKLCVQVRRRARGGADTKEDDV